MIVIGNDKLTTMNEALTKIRNHMREARTPSYEIQPSALYALSIIFEESEEFIKGALRWEEGSKF